MSCYFRSKDSPSVVLRFADDDKKSMLAHASYIEATEADWKTYQDALNGVSKAIKPAKKPAAKAKKKAPAKPAKKPAAGTPDALKGKRVRTPKE